MYHIRNDIKFRYDKSSEVYFSLTTEEIMEKLAGLSLMDAIRKQGYFVTDVFRELRMTLCGQYLKMLDYCKCRKVMENKYCQDLNVWHDIKQACDRLGILWEGWKDLPELPDDDF